MVSALRTRPITAASTGRFGHLRGVYGRKQYLTSKANAALLFACRMCLPGAHPAAFLVSDLGLEGKGEVAAQLVHPPSGAKWGVAVKDLKADRGRQMVGGLAGWLGVLSSQVESILILQPIWPGCVLKRLSVCY